MKENVIQDKSYKFAIKIIEIFRDVGKNEPVLAKQLLRSGTSVGANVEEAIGAQTKKDFFAKMTIAYKEARESLYWIRLMQDTKILSPDQGTMLKGDCEEILRIIGAIQKSVKNSTELDSK